MSTCLPGSRRCPRLEDIRQYLSEPDSQFGGADQGLHTARGFRALGLVDPRTAKWKSSADCHRISSVIALEVGGMHRRIVGMSL